MNTELINKYGLDFIETLIIFRKNYNLTNEELKEIINWATQPRGEK